MKDLKNIIDKLASEAMESIQNFEVEEKIERIKENEMLQAAKTELKAMFADSLGMEVTEEVEVETEPSEEDIKAILEAAFGTPSQPGDNGCLNEEIKDEINEEEVTVNLELPSPLIELFKDLGIIQEVEEDTHEEEEEEVDLFIEFLNELLNNEEYYEEEEEIEEEDPNELIKAILANVFSPETQDNKDMSEEYAWVEAAIDDIEDENVNDLPVKSFLIINDKDDNIPFQLIESILSSNKYFFSKNEDAINFLVDEGIDVKNYVSSVKLAGGSLQSVAIDLMKNEDTSLSDFDEVLVMNEDGTLTVHQNTCIQEYISNI